MSIKDKITGFLKTAKTHWRTPPEGRYMSYREILSLSGGGIGVRLIVWAYGQMIISIGNTLIGNTIGIDPQSLYVIYIISLITAFPLTAIRSSMIDNTRSMKGKYRPYILTMGIPTAILGSLFVWMPYENMSMLMKCAVVLGFNIAFQFFYNFFHEAYDSIINVLSPNSIERSDVLSIKSIVENISPSVINIIFPLLAKAITGENTLYDIKIFRVVFPPSMILGFALSMFVYLNTEEKIIQAKTHLVRIKFVDAFKAVAKNKYFWIISLAGWMGFLEGAFANIIQWSYNYQNACSAGQYALITAIAGNASFWPNLVAPLFIRKYGKKNILIFSNIMNIGLIAVMVPVVRLTGTPGGIWLLLFCSFVNTFMSALGNLLTPGVNADIRDYQQYVTGERIDGMFSAVGLIGNIVTMATSSVLPIIYNRAGLNSEVAISLGYDGTNVYDVLNNKEYFISICSILLLASVVGAAMNVIPYFFYDFSEVKQKGVVTVLKIRAAFEDMNNGVDVENKQSEIDSIAAETGEYLKAELYDIKAEAKKIKGLKGAARKEAKKNLRAMAEHNEKTKIAQFVSTEINKYNTPEGTQSFERAVQLSSAGLHGFIDYTLPSKTEVKKMPKNSPAEKQARKDMLELISDMKAAKKAVSKYYPDGIEEFDMSVFEKLFEAEDKNEAELNETAKLLKTAKETKNGDVAELKEKYAGLRQTKKDIEKEIKKATDYNSIYHRAAKPYLDACAKVKEKNNYDKFIING